MTLINSRKEEGPEYPPPRPFLPLSNSNWQNQLPNLFHSFFKARIDGGQGLQDDGFDHSHSQIGSLGQIVVKAPPMAKKKVEVEKKKKVAKVVYVFLCLLLPPSRPSESLFIQAASSCRWVPITSCRPLLLVDSSRMCIKADSQCPRSRKG
jgi:hypothetical protein